MKRILTAIALLAVSATQVFATTTTKIGFRAYSTQTPVTCNIFATDKLANVSGTQVPIFAPKSDFSRSYSLGTKGMANYSTLKVRAVKYSCVNTGTSTLVNVKVFLNGIETYFLTASSDTFGIAP